MREEARRWLRQAQADLKAAQDSFKNKHFEWSCFQAQQSAEKSLKFYLYSLGFTSLVTHSIKMLVKECRKQTDGFSELGEAASILDAYYIPTRYPNGLDTDKAPVDYYDEKDAQKCLNYATLILNTVKRYAKG